ncbi:Pheromone-processing carboxypeptidase KEX1 [Dissostichus eleginoides]|uniref:Pheromone-processing carboxypeptidase KEX1 n=1 Tax=Dissostichus eleginoides TaxID=100907 RepID=A0AAD9F2M3_DISEL|nr:Pheromone-processing carboxypeptidase KEX1 [Dissostichus eleginoides]
MSMASHIATLRVQPVLFHINISQRDQAPALCALPQGARIPHKLTLIQSPEVPSTTGVVTGPKFTQKCVAWGREVLWPPLTRVKLYQTSHHYKLIPQPQEGLHNGQCFVGVTQASPLTQGSGLSVDEIKTPTTMTTQAMATKPKTPKPKPNVEASENTGIIILFVIILFAVVFGVACYCARKRQRSQSVDFTSRPDDANIPFSTFDVDTAPHKGLQTFESTTKELQEPEAKPEVQEEQTDGHLPLPFIPFILFIYAFPPPNLGLDNDGAALLSHSLQQLHGCGSLGTAETDKSVDDPGETAALVPPPGSAEGKPKEEAVEQSPPPPVELSVEEKTDDEGVVSNKTSVESLKETNENNSNSADFSQKKVRAQLSCLMANVGGNSLSAWDEYFTAKRRQVKESDKGRFNCEREKRCFSVEVKGHGKGHINMAKAEVTIGKSRLTQ